MTHVKRFQGIPMSKVSIWSRWKDLYPKKSLKLALKDHQYDLSKHESMRVLCKEEDYEFLGKSEKTTNVGMTSEGSGIPEDEWRERKEERVRRRLERERLERERLREIEESKKEKEQQWRSHVEELTVNQEKNLHDRLARIRRFREFQRKVLASDSALQAGASGQSVDRLLTRM